MKRYNEKIYELAKEILDMTIRIKELLLKERYEGLPEILNERGEKIKKLTELIEKAGEKEKKKIKPVLEKILKIDAENSDNIKEKMKHISEELKELTKRRKILNYLRL